MTKYFKLALATIALVTMPASAQTTSSQFNGEFFTATVMNTTVAKQNGNVFVTVRFTGKGFSDDLRVSLGRTGEKEDDCATLLDSNGGQYVAVKCLPTGTARNSSSGNNGYVHQWDGQGGLVIRPNIDAVVVFQFRPVDRAPLDESITYNFISNIFLDRCVWQQGVFGMGCADYVNSEQSLSFFDLTAR